MSDPIQIIADKIINEKQHVVLYGAGWNAVFLIRDLQKKYAVSPTALCDGNVLKCHKDLENIPVFFVDDILSTYPDAFFFITSRIYKYEMIGNLLNSGIAEEKILNYEPIERRRSCTFLESQIFVFNHLLQFCFSDFGKNQSPSIGYKSDVDTTLDSYLSLRDSIIYNLNHSISTSCDGCPCLSDNWFAADKKITTIDYGEGGFCNFNCCFCNSSAKTSRVESAVITLPDLIKTLTSKNLLPEDVHITISCGEISVNPRRTEIYNVLENKFSRILSNSSIFDQRIAQLLREGKCVLNISVDAGTKETYARVKGADLFEKVQKNLHLYAIEGAVELKYVFLPSINDNKADIEGFIGLCKYIKPRLVQLSHDFTFTGPLPRQTISMAMLMAEKLKQNNILYDIISDKINRQL